MAHRKSWVDTKKIKLEKGDSFDDISQWCHEEEFALELLYECAKTIGTKRMGNDWKKYFGCVYGIGRRENGDKLGDCHWMPFAQTSWLEVKVFSGCMVSEGSDCGLAWE